MITLYHGSDTEIKEIDLDQARKFAKYKADNPESKTKTQVVTKFETEDATFTDGILRIKRFDGYTLEELMESLKWKRCTYQYCFISEEAIKRLKATGTV